jgi:hypothetical protein
MSFVYLGNDFLLLMSDDTCYAGPDAKRTIMLECCSQLLCYVLPVKQSSSSTNDLHGQAAKQSCPLLVLRNQDLPRKGNSFVPYPTLQMCLRLLDLEII